MVKVHWRQNCEEVPAAELISAGQSAIFNKISQNSNTNGFRLVYNGKTLKEEDLKNLNDNDSIRVIQLAESKDKAPISDEHRQKVNTEMKSIADIFRNSDDRRLHGFDHDFSLPDHIVKIVKKHPNLIFNSRFLSVLRDWNLFRAYYIKDSYKNDVERRELRYRNPETFDVVREVLDGVSARYGIMRMGQRGGVVHVNQQPAITQAMLQQALNAALTGFNPLAPAAPAAAPAQAPPPQQQPPQQEEPMEQGYEQQMAILLEYGFENAELNRLALEQTNGDIQAAMEFLLEMA